MKRLPRPFLLAAIVLTLVLGAAGTAALMTPMPTDAAAGPTEDGIDTASAECPARVAEAARGFSATLASLSGAAEAGRAERCEAYRAHVAALSSARDVYATCLSGFARDDQVAQIELATNDWHSAIAVTCAD
ncbi:hypothetical protein [Microbaculum marinisediminis]|uniref:Uncharacterized protein n=1 Tax=Microbaculum marinisediminis TaxID=2931392 RepID=A0AAW5R608_9HYPH|nr:hypothetical protein [Microbaculum sp. A6E488]MCT8974842.1 hypothetical protein [Microbaculum sp. A6E488]